MFATVLVAVILVSAMTVAVPVVAGSMAMSIVTGSIAMSVVIVAMSIVIMSVAVPIAMSVSIPIAVVISVGRVWVIVAVIIVVRGMREVVRMNGHGYRDRNNLRISKNERKSSGLIMNNQLSRDAR